MVNSSCARRRLVLASTALAAFALVSLCGTGTAAAADRIVLAESFTNTG
jgi:hypothetical protein